MPNALLRILVVDDDENIRELVRLCLTQAGHVVETAGNNTEALRCAGARSFDLVITDILMPDGDGLELITGLKVVRPTVRILAISGGGRYIEGQSCLKIARGWGAHAGLIKPFGREQLLLAIEQAITPVAET